MTSIRWVVVGLVLVASAVVEASETVELKRMPTTVENKTFDPKHLPNPAPPIKPPEAACCVWDFDCDIELEYTTSEQGPVAGLGTAHAKITGIHATLSQKIVIWLPKGASAELKAHEEGHRVIAQRVYDKSEPAVRRVLESYIGRSLEGRGTEEANAAVEAVSKEVTQACVEVMGNEAGRISAVYDEITNHNMKKNPPAEKAVEMAFERMAKERTGKK